MNPFRIDQLRAIACLLFISLFQFGCRTSQAPVEVDAYTPELGSEVENTTRGVWAIEPDPELPNVLILGDSISIGYTLTVRAHLEGKANVFRPDKGNGEKPENCQGTSLGVKEIDRWLAGRKWDVIHFNWGLHDLKRVKEAGRSQNSDNPEDPYQATVEQYSANLEQLVDKLLATGPS